MKDITKSCVAGMVMWVVAYILFTVLFKFDSLTFISGYAIGFFNLIVMQEVNKGVK